MESTEKKAYSTPELTVHGAVEEITGCNKQYGPTDGNLFMGAPIQCIT